MADQKEFEGAEAEAHVPAVTTAGALSGAEMVADSPPMKVKTPILQQLGDTGLQQYNGYISEDFLQNLRGRQATKVYQEMTLNDPVIGAMVFACTMLLRRAKWRVEAANESPAAQEGQKFVEGVMDDMEHSWPSFIEEVTSMLPYGFAPFEIVWKVRKGPEQEAPEYRSRFTDSRFGVRKIALRSQDSVQRWLIDNKTDTLLGFVQQTDTGHHAIIPADRLLLFRTISRKDNPEGQSILRTSYVPYVRKKAIEDAEGRAALRAAGLVVLSIPSRLFSQDADNDEMRAYQSYKRLVSNLAKDRQGAIILPSDTDEKGAPLYKLDFLVADGRRGIDFSPIIERHNRAMAMAVLADFIFLGQQSVGSFALSSDKTALFVDALGAFQHNIEETLNRDFLPRLWDINQFNPDVMPKFKASDLESPNLGELGQYLTALSGAGASLFPDENLERYLRESANLPEQSPEAVPKSESDAAIAEEYRPEPVMPMAGNAPSGGKPQPTGKPAAKKPTAPKRPAK